MTSKLIKLTLLLLFSQMFLPVRAVLAHTGPKPTMEFTFIQEPDRFPMSIHSGTMYECDQADCSDASPLEELGPQGFRCDTENCSATAYGFAPYHKIEIEFSDGKTRQSNIFETAGFDSKYTVTVRADDLLVEARFTLGVFPRTGTVLAASCICFLVSLSLVVGTVLFLARRSKKN